MCRTLAFSFLRQPGSPAGRVKGSSQNKRISNFDLFLNGLALWSEQPSAVCECQPTTFGPSKIITSEPILLAGPFKRSLYFATDPK